MVSTSSCYKAWKKLRKRWIRRPSQVNQEDIGLMTREEIQEVLIDISITLQDIQPGEHTISQVHLLSEIIREGPGYMSYRER
jgi:hypothetical protein